MNFEETWLLGHDGEMRQRLLDVNNGTCFHLTHLEHWRSYHIEDELSTDGASSVWRSKDYCTMLSIASSRDNVARTLALLLIALKK